MWRADELIVRATQQAIAWLQAIVPTDDFVYLVRDLSGYRWHDSAVRHDVTSDGLLFVRPLVSPDRILSEQREPDSHLAWTFFNSLNGSEAGLTNLVNECLPSYLGPAEDVPPVLMRAALAAASERLETPIVYFSSFMWGGTVETEYALVYAPHEVLLLTENSDAEQRCATVSDSLQSALAYLGLALPTGFFAPHTGSFDWSSHRLSPNDRVEP